MIQIDSEIVVIAAIKQATTCLLSTVPLVVSSILERHSLLVDTVVLVNKGPIAQENQW